MSNIILDLHPPSQSTIRGLAAEEQCSSSSSTTCSIRSPSGLMVNLKSLTVTGEIEKLTVDREQLWTQALRFYKRAAVDPQILKKPFEVCFCILFLHQLRKVFG